jgi:hypothetical protein
VAWGVAAGVVIAGFAPSLAGGTLTWTESAEQLARGKAEGLALTRRGRLFLAPRLVSIGAPLTPLGPVQIWAMTSDRDSNVYFGTGPQGQILKLGRSGQPRLFFQVEEPMVTALAVTAGGDILAGTAPGGRVYRIGRDGTGEPWAETGERYVWSLVAAAGEVYAGTGERGKILRISESGAVELLFDTDESHVVSLLSPADGVLLAGGAGRGLIYRVDEEGHALVLHDDELPEVVALAVEPGGAVLAALVAPPGPAVRRPALRLQLPDGVQVGTSDAMVGMLEEGTGTTLRGTIEGLDRPEERPRERVQGRLVRIDVSGASTELWSSNTESPFCLAQDDRGRVLFGTGEPARLYRVEPDGDVSRLATLPEAQLSGLLGVGRRIYASTSNPAAAYRLDDDIVDTGSFTSRPFDAGGPARWGSIRWSVEHPAGRTELYTRTGNSHEPDETWSAWSPALTDTEGSRIVNPDGRFLQWRVRQIGGPQAATFGVSVPYEPLNRAPRMFDFRVEPRSGGGAEKTFQWTSRDPDGDPLRVTIEYRPPGSAGWATAAVQQPPTGRPAADRRIDVREGRLVWDTAEVPEGRYEVRAVASDQLANAPGEGLEATAEPVLRIVIDRTPPEIEVHRLTDGATGIRLADALSDIDRLELLLDGRTRFIARADDGVCDSPSETFRLTPPEPTGSGPWTLRGTDAAGNAVVRPLQQGEDAN